LRKDKEPKATSGRGLLSASFGRNKIAAVIKVFGGGYPVKWEGMKAMKKKASDFTSLVPG